MLGLWSGTGFPLLYFTLFQLPSIDGGSFNATIAYVSYPGRMHINKVSENPKLEDLMEKLNMEYEKLADSSNLPRLQVQPTIG